MRPKVVITVLVAAIALLGIMAVIKGRAGKPAGDSGPAGGTGTQVNSGATATNGANQVSSGPGVKPVVSAELRAALIAGEKEKILELQGEVDGSNNPVILAALMDKVGSPELEVRDVALEAIKEIDDTNAIPALQKLADGTQDQLVKDEAMKVVEYLSLPGISDGATAEDMTNHNVTPPEYPVNTSPNQQVGTPNRIHGKNRHSVASQKQPQASPTQADQTQTSQTQVAQPQ